MNSKLFFACLLTTFGMLFWLFFQPTESMNFIGIRIIVAFCAAVMMIFSFTWNEKKTWKKTTLVILVILGVGSVAHLAFSYGIAYYPKTTITSMVAIAISCLLYIKFLEPRVLKRVK